MFLITGHPRSGTGYMHKALSECGLAVGDEGYPAEALGRQPCDVTGVVSWRHVALAPDAFDVVIHQVRDPLKVISSAQTLKGHGLRLMFQHIPPLEQALFWRLLDSALGLRRRTDTIRRCMHTWLRWNERIERHPKLAHRFRIEDVRQAWSALADFLPLAGRPFPAAVPTDHHSRRDKYEFLGWRSLRNADPVLWAEVRTKAREYGYDPDAPPREMTPSAAD